MSTAYKQLCPAAPGWLAVSACLDYEWDLESASASALLHVEPIACFAVVSNPDEEDVAVADIELVVGLVVGDGDLEPAGERSPANLELINLCGPDVDPFTDKLWLKAAREVIASDRQSKTPEARAALAAFHARYGIGS